MTLSYTGGGGARAHRGLQRTLYVCASRKPITERSRVSCSCDPQTGGCGAKPHTGMFPKQGRDSGYIHSSSSSIFILYRAAMGQLPISEPHPQTAIRGVRVTRDANPKTSEFGALWPAMLGSSPRSASCGAGFQAERERKAPFFVCFFQ